MSNWSQLAIASGYFLLKDIEIGFIEWEQNERKLKNKKKIEIEMKRNWNFLWIEKKNWKKSEKSGKFLIKIEIF